MAAAADFRPAAPIGQARPRSMASASTSSRPRMSSPASPPSARDGQALVGFAAEHGGESSRGPGPSSAARASTRRRQRRLRQLDRLRERRQRGDPDRRSERAEAPSVAGSIAAQGSSRSPWRAGSPRPADAQTQAFAPARPARGPAPPPERAILASSFFVPMQYSRSGPGPLFLRPEPANQHGRPPRQTSSSSSHELDSELDLVAVEQPGHRGAAPLHRPPRRASTWRSANGSPSTSTTCWPSTRSRCPRPVPSTANTRSPPVSKEIVEAVHALEHEKGISADR